MPQVISQGAHQAVHFLRTLFAFVLRLDCFFSLMRSESARVGEGANFLLMWLICRKRKRNDEQFCDNFLCICIKTI